MKNSIVALIALLNAGAALAEGLPILDSAEKLDQTWAFQDVNGGYVYLPTFFSANLKCLGEPEPQYCQVNIKNSTSNAAKGILSEWANLSIVATPLRADLSSSTVFGLTENFVGNLSNYLVPTSIVGLKTLALVETNYSNLYLRGSGKELNAINATFQDEGVGQFRVAFKLRGLDTFERLQLNTGTAFFENLNAIGSRTLSYDEFKAALAPVLSLALRSKGLDLTEAQIIAARYLKTNLMRRTKNGRFRVDEQKLAQFKTNYPKKIVILEELGETKTINCESVLEIKKNSLATTRCEGIQ